MKPLVRARAACKWLCTVLAAVIIVCLVGGRWWMLRLTWTSGDRSQATLTIGAGTLRACRSPVGFWAPTGLRIDKAPRWEWGWSGKEDRMLPGEWRLGFLYCKDPNVPRLFGMALFFPAAVIVVPTALLWWIDVRAWLRGRAGRCPVCGYDRRGLVADAPCPECGAPGPAAAPTT